MKTIKHFLENLNNDINNWVGKKSDSEITVTIEPSPRREFGDFSCSVALPLAKACCQPALSLAEELKEFLDTKSFSEIEKITVVKPGFINFFLKNQMKRQYLQTVIKQGNNFGNNNLHKNEKWVVEHTSPNPNKTMHLGHLRNNLVGMSIVRLLENAGAQVTADAVYNDRGIAIAKVMYGYLLGMKKQSSLPTDVLYWYEHQDSWWRPEEKNIKPDIFVSQCYVLGEQVSKNSSWVDSQVRKLVRDWENEDKKTWDLWKLVLNFSYQGISQTLKRLGNRWDKIWYEHEHYKAGKDYVKSGLEQGIFKRLEDGAILTDLENYNLSDTVLLKRDGTALYITQDIALTDLKKKTYQADKLIWVIGPDQSLAMKQMFAVCEQLGIGKLSDFTHITYGYVGLKGVDGGFTKMSSRAGTVVTIDDVIDRVKKIISENFPDLNNVTESDLTEKLALAAVKFAFLRSDRKQDLVFDFNQSVNLQGDSGVYVLYTFVRIRSILNKVTDLLNNNEDLAVYDFGEADELVRHMLYFEQVIEKSTKNLSIHYVAQYLLDICSMFNGWYAKEVILDNTDKQILKLKIVEGVAVLIKKGLGLMGIETIDKM